MIEPPETGAVAAMVKLAVPAALLAGSALDSVTVQVSFADATLRFVQLTDDTPVPAVAEVAVTPVGNWSATVAEVPDGDPPSLPIPIV